MADDVKKTSSSSSTNILEKKFGPFSGEIWLVLGLGLVAAFIYYLRQKSSSNSTASSANTTSDANIPQIVNQTYSTTPVSVTVSNPTTPPTVTPTKPTPPIHGGPVKAKPPTKSSPGKTYTVQPGDTLTGIAKAYGVKHWQTIYDANKSIIGSNPNLIKPGQHLKIPDATKTPKLHNTYYTVRSGDTLSGIAKKYDTTWEDIYAENRSEIKNPNQIKPGERILIQKNGTGNF